MTEHTSSYLTLTTEGHVIDRKLITGYYTGQIVCIPTYHSNSQRRIYSHKGKTILALSIRTIVGIALSILSKVHKCTHHLLLVNFTNGCTCRSDTYNNTHYLSYKLQHMYICTWSFTVMYIVCLLPIRKCHLKKEASLYLYIGMEDQ